MLRPLAPIAVANALALTAAPLYARPCSGRTSVAALEQMLPQVRTALALPGTDQITVNNTTRCIEVQVRTRGTARLVKLMLRGLEVPRDAVEFRVIEARRAT